MKEREQEQVESSLEEASEESVEALGDGHAAEDVKLFGISDEGGGLESSEGFEPFSAGDGERPILVWAGDPSCALGDVEHRALCGAKSFIAELRVADVGGLDDEQELDGDVVGDEAVVR